MRQLGRYEVLDEIAGGGMAVVYAGRVREQPSELVALKVIRSHLARDKAFLDMFADEAAISARLRHPNIVAVRELGHDEGQHFLAMELVLGQTLATVADTAHERGIALPWEAVAWIGARVADGLHYAHTLEGRDIVHRDVNPSNVIVTYDGRPKIIDFGLARAADRITSTAHGIVKGKLAYLAPEQALGKKDVDGRTDVFALGITLWELTTGRRLFKADDDVTTIRRAQACEVPDPSSIVPEYPAELARIVMRALEREPEKRWQSAGELAEALDAFVAKRADEASVAKLLAGLFPPDRARKPWERAIETVFRNASRHDGILAWDDEAKKMTFLQLEGGTREMPSHDGASVGAILERLAKSEDASIAARAHVELAIAAELAGDREGAAEHAGEALERDGKSVAAHWIARRARHARGEPLAVLEHLDAEIESATSEGARADLHGERARLLWAAGEAKKKIVAEWERALALRPNDPAALGGLEAAFAAGGEKSAPKLAAHLARMIEASSDEPKLAAWLHVERARVLDALEDRAGAAQALSRALALDPGLGPVRDACVRDAIAHRELEALGALLESQAELEPDPARAAALELDAACIARRVSKDGERAERLLAQASSRASSGLVAERVLDELAQVREERGEWVGARLARATRIERAPDRANAAELRTMAELAERAGDVVAAISDLERALARDRGDEVAFDRLERLVSGDPEKLEALLADQAAHTRDPARRAAMFVRASDIARARERLPQAIGYLRAAVAAAPDDAEVIARLAELLATPAASEDASAKIAVYARAADTTTDAAARVAWLERVAVLQEEVAGDPAAAKATWTEVRRLEPARRSAVMGLARAAARAGDEEGYATALLDEAAIATDPAAARRARLRAAEALARVDERRALRLLDDAVKKTPDGDDARALVVRIHERAKRFGEAIAARAERIARAADPRAKAALLVAQAAAQHAHLGDRRGALESLRAAHAIEPGRPGLAEDVARLLAGDPRALRAWLAELAASAEGAARALAYARAGELDELVLGDDAAALEAYEKAHAALPDDPWLASRLAAVRTRAGGEPPSAPDDGSIAALRATIASARARDAMPPLANALEQLFSAARSDHARLVALWEQAAIIEWRLPENDSVEVYERILERTPEGRAALDALLRRASPRAVTDADARATALRALTGLLAHAPDDGVRAAMSIELAAMLESSGDRAGALARYREAMRSDPRSPTAVLGAARLAEALRDVEASIDAWCARADLADDGPSRAAFLVRAAGPLASRTNEGERERAAKLLETALEADPCSLPAAAALISMLQAGQPDRLIAVLRLALARADRPDAIVMIGMELARVAGGRPSDRPIAVSALERVRAAAPRHVGALLALADAYAAESAWSDAIAAFEAAAEHATDVASKKRALLALADLHERISKSAPEALRALRAACDLDPRDGRVLRALVQRLRSESSDSARSEIAQRLEQLAAAEPTHEAKAAAYLELFDTARGDRPRAERALAFAVAESPTPENLARLAAFAGAPPGGATEHARVLGLVLARGAEIQRPSGAPFGALALLEIDSLGRIAEGVAHAKTALALAPGAHESRGALARGLARLGQHDEAISTAMPMLEHDAEALLALAQPDALLDTLESSLNAARREQRALVVRELRTIGGGAGDAVAVGLRARRLPASIEAGPPAIDRATLWNRVLPPEARSVLLEVAAAIAPITAAIFPTELESNGAHLRGNVAPGHPLAAPFARVAAQLGFPDAELHVSDAVRYPRAAAGLTPVVIAPPGLAGAPDPVQSAALARPLVRIALGMPWLDRARAEPIRALLVAAARLVSPRYAADRNDRALEAAVAEVSKPLARAIGRTQKKALSALQPRLDTDAGPTIDDVRLLVRGVSQAELRVAFLLTGDLLATLDDLRASDGDYARAASTPGPSALAATLRHPLAGDAVRFALGDDATAIRRSAGTIWTGPALAAVAG